MMINPKTKAVHVYKTRSWASSAADCESGVMSAT